MRVLRIVFGPAAQIIVGGLVTIAAAATWVYGSTLHGEALVRLIFHVSMAAFVVAAYAIVATGLGYLETRRVRDEITP